MPITSLLSNGKNFIKLSSDPIVVIAPKGKIRKKTWRNTRSIALALVLIVLLTCFSMYGYLAGKSEENVELKQQVVTQHSAGNERNSTNTAKVEKPTFGEGNTNKKHHDPSHGLVTILEERLSSLNEALSIFHAKLQNEYSYQYYSFVFDRDTVMDKDFRADSLSSKNRLKRRLQEKILKSLSTNGEGSGATFTWATGGHSASAGHGNLFSQSYTHVMTDAAAPVFESVGLNFIGKNYAMGGTSSGSNIALCMDQIFGIDIDILSWDYGMTDSRMTTCNSYLWMNRIALHPTTPIAVTFAGKTWSTNGTGLITFDQQSLKDKIAGLPDSSTIEDIESLPNSLRYMTCGGKIESKDGVCEGHKWNTSGFCTKTTFQASWHPGWKIHKLKGRLMAFFMVESLHEAMEDLYSIVSSDTLTIDNAEKLRDSLISQDEVDINQFLNRTMEGYDYGLKGKQNGEGQRDIETFNIAKDAMYRSANIICQTTILPSETRYNGIATNTGHVGDFRDKKYDAGFSNTNPPIRNKGTRENPQTLLLMYDGKERKRAVCDENVIFAIDFKDYYLLRDDDGWVSTTFPNDMEIDSYSDGSAMNGFILLCGDYCYFGKCPEDWIFFSEELLNDSKSGLTIEIDGEPVVAAKHFGTCFFLENKNNGLNWGPGKDGSGQYKIDLKMNKAGGALKILAIIAI